MKHWVKPTYDFNGLAKNSPVTTQTLADVEKAKIVHDDITNLSSIESALQFGKDAGKTLGAGLFAGTAGAAGAVEAVNKNLGDLFDPVIPDGYNPWYQQVADLQALRHQQQAWSDYLKPEATTTLGKGAVSGVMSLAQNLPTLGAAIVTRNPNLALSAMTGMTFGQTYGEDTDKGINTPSATVHAAANAAVEYGTEGWSMGKLFGDLNAGSSLLKTMLHQVVPELAGEQAATALQGLTDWTVQHPDKPVKDYLDTMPEAAAETLVATVVGMGGNAALLKTIDTVQNVSNLDLGKAKNSGNTFLNLEQLKQLLAASKVHKRDPGLMHDFIEQATETSDVKNLYIDAQTLMQSGVGDKLAEVLPDVAEQLPAALVSGGEIKIPIADYLTHIANTELDTNLSDHLRIEGEDYTRATAKDYIDNHTEELNTQLNKALEEHQIDDAFKTSTDSVKSLIKSQLDTASHFDGSVNDAYASLVASFYAVHAQKLGTTPEALYQQYPLKVDSLLSEGQVFGQGKPVPNTTELGAFKTGQPVTFDFQHNTESATKIFGKPKKDAPYDRGIEPSGRYVTQVKDASKVDTSGHYISGTLSFKNPLVLNSETWKKDLFDHYKKRGKALSKALIADGYDGVVTISHDERPGRSDTSEILDLTTFDESKALYQSVNDEPLLAPNGKPSNLNAVQHAQVRTEAFKKWFGDWEALVKQNEIDAFIDNAMAENDPRGSLVLRDVTEAERDEVLRQGGPDISGMQHILDAQEIRHAKNKHGKKNEKSRQPDQRPLTIDDLKHIAAVLDGYDDIKVQPRGTNQTSLIYSKEFPDGKIEYVERVFETSEKHKPRLVTKTVWVKVTTGVKPSPTQVYNPDHDVNLPFKGGRVNPDSVSKVVDENGEPLVVYHGSDEGFDTFLKEKIGTNIVLPNGAPRGFYFAKDKALAEKYGKTVTAAFISGEPLLNNSKIVVAGEPAQIKSATGNNGNFDGNDANILHQDKLANRGSFSPSTNTITLLKKADLTTFLHETGHFFLETQFDIAARMAQDVTALGATPGQQAILDDTQALLNWFGVDSLDTWFNLDFEEKRAYHEKFAEGFEKYLGSGKAPSLELQPLFQRFRAWILDVYKSLKAINVQLTPEVKAVMNRMIASDEQIRLAEQARSMMPLFETAEQAGMTPEDFAHYQQLGEDATNTAIDALSAKANRDMQWLSNARAKSLRKMQKKHDALRRDIRSEIRTQVMSQPVYQAWAFLTGKLPEDNQEQPDTFAGRIELTALKGMNLPPEIEQRIIKLKMTAKQGLSADVVSDIVPGFSSGDALLRAIAAAEDPKALIEKLTDQTMLERHSELATPEAVQKAADQAISNAVRLRFVATEANALAEATGSVKLLEAAAKELATALISRLKIRDILPYRYARAEVKAAKLAEKALQKGNVKQAATEKRNQLINLHLGKTATEALEDVDKMIRYFRNFGGKHVAIDAEYLAQINALLDKFDLRKQSGTEIDETTRLRAWVQLRLADGELPVVAETLLNPQARAAYVAQIESRDSHGRLVYADDDERIKLLANVLGDLSGIPAVQVNRTLTGAKAIAEGKTNNPLAIGFGFKN